ncbi:hypothetical protein Tco_1373327, partial [Tanacetum coccineum]
VLDQWGKGKELLGNSSLEILERRFECSPKEFATEKSLEELLQWILMIKSMMGLRSKDGLVLETEGWHEAGLTPEEEL